MKHLALFSLACVVFLASQAENAQAQRRRPFSRPRLQPNERPTLSPYLNLLDNRRSLEFQYFREVRPEFQWRRNQSQFRRSLQNIERDLERQEELIQSESSTIGPTGHESFFMNTGGYFGAGGIGPRGGR